MSNGAGSIWLLGGGGGETHGFSSMRENMQFVIQDNILLGGGDAPHPDYWGGRPPAPPASGAYVNEW